MIQWEKLLILLSCAFDFVLQILRGKCHTVVLTPVHTYANFVSEIALI